MQFWPWPGFVEGKRWIFHSDVVPGVCLAKEGRGKQTKKHKYYQVMHKDSTKQIQKISDFSATAYFVYWGMKSINWQAELEVDLSCSLQISDTNNWTAAITGKGTVSQPVKIVANTQETFDLNLFHK